MRYTHYWRLCRLKDGSIRKERIAFAEPRSHAAALAEVNEWNRRAALQAGIKSSNLLWHYWIE